MKSILLFDTSIASLNIGDEIINESIKTNCHELFDGNYLMTFPTHTPSFYIWQNKLVKKNSIYRDADYKFICGTNILYTNMLRPEPAWNLFLGNTSIAKGSICIGAGIGVNSDHVNLYTRKFYDRVLSHSYIHSVRDEKTKDFLNDLGFKAYNTGCATLWGLTEEHCSLIPCNKQNKVVFTLTSYEPNVFLDYSMVKLLEASYDKLYFWPQSLYDIDYLKSLNVSNDIVILPPNLKAYKSVLCQDIDYVGNRLHGGIFALQNKCRSIIISIDYRAEEMAKQYSFPCIRREEINNSLSAMINSSWETKIGGLNYDLIEEWKSQFTSYEF